ncbi:MAG TPA: hypothetical protein PLD84_04430 [Chitinophagales bacterium]|nr:hypothetical protein [Chitinophagales bacterium]
MSVLPQLATSLNRRDEVPNTELAKKIAESHNHAAVKELVSQLYHKDKNIQHDCIKVLYETGERNPSLIAPYFNDFLKLLESRNNRMLWGAMTALDTIALEKPAATDAALLKIEAAASKGSVIARDHAVNIFIKLCTISRYAEHAFNLLILQIQWCPANQLAMYAEKALPLITGKNKRKFVQAVSGRLPIIVKESARKRLKKILEQCTRIK